MVHDPGNPEYADMEKELSEVTLMIVSFYIVLSCKIIFFRIICLLTYYEYVEFFPRESVAYAHSQGTALGIGGNHVAVQIHEIPLDV